MGQRGAQIGARLKKTRQSLKMTQKQLADKLGVSQTAIALWENGSREISLEIIDELTNILNVSDSYLLFGESDINDFDSNQIEQERADLNARKLNSQRKLLELYKQARDKAEEELEFLTAEIQDLNMRIEKIEKILQAGRKN